MPVPMAVFYQNAAFQERVHDEGEKQHERDITAILVVGMFVHVPVFDAFREKLQYQLQKKTGQHVITHLVRIVGTQQHIGQDVDDGNGKQVGATESQQDLEEVLVIFRQKAYEPARKKHRKKQDQYGSNHGKILDTGVRK